MFRFDAGKASNDKSSDHPQTFDQFSCTESHFLHCKTQAAKQLPSILLKPHYTYQTITVEKPDIVERGKKDKKHKKSETITKVCPVGYFVSSNFLVLYFFLFFLYHLFILFFLRSED